MYKERFTEEEAVGWDALETHIQKTYPEQVPQLFGNEVPYVLGGGSPLDGISVYEQADHWHLLGFGCSELYYNEKSASEAFSKFGFELSFRVKKLDGLDFEWAIELMQNLAKYVYASGKWFEPLHFMPTNGPICYGQATDLVGLIFVLDPVLGSVETPNGRVDYLQMVGITESELSILQNHAQPENVKKLLQQLSQENALLITDLTRKSV
jgi:hypothetical protein